MLNTYYVLLYNGNPADKTPPATFGSAVVLRGSQYNVDVIHGGDKWSVIDNPRQKRSEPV